MYFYVRAYDLNNMYFNVCSFPWSCMHQASMYGESKFVSSCYICACAFCIFYICVVPYVLASPFSFPVLPSVFLSLCVPPWQGQDTWLNKQYEDDPDISKEVSFVHAPSHKHTLTINMSNWMNARSLKYSHKITICMSILLEFFYFKNSTTRPQSVTPTDLITCAFLDPRQESGRRLLQNLAESSRRQDQGGWRCMGKFWKVFSTSLWLD